MKLSIVFSGLLFLAFASARGASPLPLAFTGAYRATISVTHLSRDLLEKAFASKDKSEITIDHSRSIEVLKNYGIDTATGESPVVVFWGNHHNLKDPKGEPAFNTDGSLLSDYNEVILMIPNVIYKSQHFAFMQRLFLDEAMPVAIGKTYYGYDKRMGKFYQHSNPDYTSVAVSSEGHTVFKATSKKVKYAAGDKFINLFNDLVASNFIGATETGVVCSQFKVAIRKNALVPVVADIMLGRDFFRPQGVGAGIHLKGVASYNVINDWELSVPDPGCSSF